MISQTPPQIQGSQIKKIKKIPRSPEKYVVTGQTQNVIRSVNESQYANQQIVDNTSLLKSKQRVLLQNLGLIYEGSIVNNTPHGQGSLFSNDGKVIFSGTWINGARNGWGHYIYPDNTQYKGNWVNNLKEGQGAYYNNTGQKYEGQWVQNLRHGKGRMDLGGGISFDGLWQNDEFVSGTITYPNGGVYQGDVRNFNRNGQGTYIYPNNDKFSGQWANNMKQGLGQYNFSNNDEFRGTFKDNLRHGTNCQYIWKDKGYEMTNANFIRDKCQNGTAVRK